MVTEIGPGKTIQATDGKSAWVVSPLGTRLLKGADQEDSLREATFNSELLAKELFQKVECTGIENVEGKPAYKVVLTAPRPAKSKPSSTTRKAISSSRRQKRSNRRGARSRSRHS